MRHYSSSIIDVPSRPLATAALSHAYWLLALAMAITFVGVVAGATFALPIITSGFLFPLLILEVIIVWTSRAWVRSSPLNILLFTAFPFLSGLTVTPFLLGVASQYANGTVILLNASLVTALLSVASAVYVSITKTDLQHAYGFILFQSLLGLLIVGVLQIFFPIFRGQTFEVLISGVGIVTFAIFLAVDMQRLQKHGAGESPFLLALSLYLDIFNLFLYVVRFMVAMSGRRR